MCASFSSLLKTPQRERSDDLACISIPLRTCLSEKWGDVDADDAASKSEKKSAEMGGKMHAVHECIRSILRTNPLSCSVLGTIVVEEIPENYASVLKHKLYARAALLIAEYVPVLRTPIIRAMMTRMTDMDVDVRVDDLDDEALALEDDEQLRARQIADKLDVMMVEFFSYIDRNCDLEQVDKARARGVMKVLLRTFDVSLTAKGTTFVQFIFFCVRKAPRICKRVCGAAAEKGDVGARSVRSSGRGKLSRIVPRARNSSRAS